MTRGFTGHEMIDDVGLVNMNGRIYDPEIGRFLSADPIVQDLTDSQSLNRYSYVRNNPLSLVDPSGFSWLSSLFTALARPGGTLGFIFQHAVDAFFRDNQWAQSLLMVASASCLQFAALCAAANASYISGINGGSVGDMAKGAAIAGISAYATAGVGGAGLNPVVAAVASGAIGCASSVASGGKCGAGFLAAGFSSLAGPYVSDNYYVGTVQSAIIGGVASVIGGGKFENGAVTGAFAYLAGRLVRDLKSYPQEESEYESTDSCNEWCNGIDPTPISMKNIGWGTVTVPDKLYEFGQNLFRMAPLLGSALKTDAFHHLANLYRSVAINYGQMFLTPSRSAPGMSLLLQYSVTTTYGAGIVEYLYDFSRFGITHQSFIPGAPVSGMPNNWYGKKYLPYGAI